MVAVALIALLVSLTAGAAGGRNATTPQAAATAGPAPAAEVSQVAIDIEHGAVRAGTPAPCPGPQPRGHGGHKAGPVNAPCPPPRPDG